MSDIMEFKKTIGLPYFSISLKLDSDVCSLSAMTLNNDRSVTKVFADGYIVIDPDFALSTLSSHWYGIASPFMGENLADYIFDFTDLVEGLNGVNFHISRNKNDICVGSHNGEYLGSDSVCVVEILLTLGNELAKLSSENVSKLWFRVSSKTELPPFAVIDDVSFCQSKEDFDSEVAWYAQADNQSIDDYISTAHYEFLKQVSFELGFEDYSQHSDVGQKKTPTSSNLASEEALTRMRCHVKLKTGMTDEEIYHASISQRNMDVRSAKVFEKFYPNRLYP